MNTAVDGRLFEWDDEKAAINFRKHGVTFQTATLIFEDNHRVEEYDFYASFYADRWKIIGTVENVALVIYSDREDFTRIISVRKATKSERRYYDEMSTVFYFLPKNAPLTAEEKAEIAALKDRPIVYDEDCPPTTKEEADEAIYLMRKYKTSCITKEILMAEFPERFSKRKAAS